jgi:cobalt-zinc-cadmium efflux system protein
MHDHHIHDHRHTAGNFGTMFAIATALNLGLVAVQVFSGVVANSVALLADAGHNFGDALGLVIAWGAHVLAKFNPTTRYTYGFRSASILAAPLNAMILLVVTGGIAWEAIGRFFEPHEVAGAIVMVVAALGIFINGLSAWLLMRGQTRDLNIRGAFLHMAARRGFSRRGSSRRPYSFDGMELARSDREYCNIGGDRLGNMGPTAGGY